MTKDDLSALGSQQFGLPLDMLDLQTDYESLEVDLGDLQVDLESDNPNDACGVAQQGLTDRNALFNDQMEYGQDVSLATADEGNLEGDENSVRRSYKMMVTAAGRANSPLPAGLRREKAALLTRVARAVNRTDMIISKDNPVVRRWVVKGVTIYMKLAKACSAVR